MADRKPAQKRCTRKHDGQRHTWGCMRKGGDFRVFEFRNSETKHSHIQSWNAVRPVAGVGPGKKQCVQPLGNTGAVLVSGVGVETIQQTKGLSSPSRWGRLRDGVGWGAAWGRGGQGVGLAPHRGRPLSHRWNMKNPAWRQGTGRRGGGRNKRNPRMRDGGPTRVPTPGGGGIRTHNTGGSRKPLWLRMSKNAGDVDE